MPLNVLSGLLDCAFCLFHLSFIYLVSAAPVGDSMMHERANIFKNLGNEERDQGVYVTHFLLFLNT